MEIPVDFIQMEEQLADKEGTAEYFIKKLQELDARKELKDHHKAMLRMMAPSQNFDIVEEIENQRAIIKIMQERVLNENGSGLEDRFSQRELTSLATSINSFLALYNKSQENINTVKQIKEIESAVVETLQEMPVEIQDQYLKALKNKLHIKSV